MKPSHLPWMLLLVLGQVAQLPAAEREEGPMEPTVDIEALGPGEVIFSYESGLLGIITNEFVVRFQDATLTAHRGQFDELKGEFVVEGGVVIQRDNQVWRGERVEYNFVTGRIQTAGFRAGRAPFFAQGEGLLLEPTRPQGGEPPKLGLTNMVYTATNAFLTSDDVAAPAYQVRARRLRISPGRYFEARDAVVYAKGVPVFYFPYLRRNLDQEANRFHAIPGYRSRYGAYVLGFYDWHWSRKVSGTLHLDYRVERGWGGGPDVKYDLGRFGSGDARFYYLHDLDAEEVEDLQGERTDVPSDRHRFYFAHQASVSNNWSVKLVAREQSDAYVTRDFFESEYRDNTQPTSFVEVSRFWPNFSLNVLAQPQINPFFETVERLPDVKLTALRQQIGKSFFYYEGESSAGYYRRNFAEEDPAEDYAAFRGDTFHQLLLPRSFFGWLQVTPRVGGRATYYSEATGRGADYDEETRLVFNTGAEVSFKLSRLWASARNRLLDVDGIRHIVQPAFNYAYTPEPSSLPEELPQFDTEWPSLRLLPIQFPDMNAIDAIDSQNVLRLGLRNKLQTKRGGQVENLLNWDVYTDWRLDPRGDQDTFADLFSDLDVRPRSWLTLTSEIRWDVEGGRFRIANHWLTLTPGEEWSWSFGHRYLREEQQLGFEEGHNLLISTFYYRLNENWVIRLGHHYEIEDHTMEEQQYTVYRDFRSWTGALTFRVRDDRDGPLDFGVAFTFQLKAFPRFKADQDRSKPSLLLGS